MDNNDSAVNSFEDVHTQANNYFLEATRLVYEVLPGVIQNIIEQDVWQEKNFKNFGEYALQPSSDGLNISNNQKLWLLKCAMDINGRHAVEWGDVLTEVDTLARKYAKKNKIQIKNLSKNLNLADSPEEEKADAITYLPSRSNSNDSQLLKLRQNDQETYTKVLNGEMSLKEAVSPPPRKQLHPIESAKNKFNRLSNQDRQAFIAWIEEQRIAAANE